LVIKGDRFSFRLPASTLQEAKREKLPLSHICRDAVYFALANREIFNENTPHKQSKKRSVQLWNKLLKNFVRTFPVEDLDKIKKNPFKIKIFGQISRQNCPEWLLGDLGEFLQGGEYSEEVLRIFLDGIDSKPFALDPSSVRETLTGTG
jgi:hypothetical protein